MKEFKKITIGTTAYAFAEILKFIKVGKEYRITVAEYKKRSISANSQQHIWYKAISEYTGEDLKSVECRCKRDFGLPILLADDQGGVVTGWMLDELKFHNRSEVQQFKIIAAMAVTSTFSTKQHNQYRDNMQSFYNQHGISIDYLEKGD